MNSAFVALAARVFIPLQIFLSVFFLLRGHNLPGGGFIGGLLLGIAGVLGVLAVGPERVQRFLRVEPAVIVGIGLLVAGLSALIGPLFNQVIFTGIWGPSVWIPLIGDTKLSSVLMFDTGVFILVFGMVMKVVFAILEEPS